MPAETLIVPVDSLEAGLPTEAAVEKAPVIDRALFSIFSLSQFRNLKATLLQQSPEQRSL